MCVSVFCVFLVETAEAVYGAVYAYIHQPCDRLRQLWPLGVSRHPEEEVFFLLLEVRYVCLLRALSYHSWGGKCTLGRCPFRFPEGSARASGRAVEKSAVE